MRKNVKVIASLVRKAKKKLYQGKREEALDLMRKAVNVDDNNGVLVQVVKAIGRKKPHEDLAVQSEEEPAPAEGSAEEPAASPTEDNTEEAKNQERTASMASDEKLEELFEASDREYMNGHQQKAVAYLKKAKKLAPDSARVKSRIELLKKKIKSANMVKIALKKLQAGEEKKALGLARQAFELFPEATGLHQLLTELEEASSRSPEPEEIDDLDIELDYDEIEVEEPQPAEDTGSSEGIINRIRELVQENSLMEAADLAQKGRRTYPRDRKIAEFVENFKKLGLIE